MHGHQTGARTQMRYMGGRTEDLRARAGAVVSGADPGPRYWQARARIAGELPDAA
jgi:hypothetical protein